MHQLKLHRMMSIIDPDYTGHYICCYLINFLSFKIVSIPCAVQFSSVRGFLENVFFFKAKTVLFVHNTIYIKYILYVCVCVCVRERTYRSHLLYV